MRPAPFFAYASAQVPTRTQPVPYSLHLHTRTAEIAGELQRALNAPGHDLAPAALAIARVEYPMIESAAYIAELDRLAEQAASRLQGARGSVPESVRALNEFLYDECGFAGNQNQYNDPRNSFLNEVLDRRTGIPISLAVVYMEVARRAGLHIDGVNFPRHFLLRAPLEPAGDGPAGEDLIIDPFHGGALLSEADCRQLLGTYLVDEAAFAPALLAPATRLDIVVRMLMNLKGLYVQMRSFPQARCISTLLLTADPAGVTELRDRGLLAFHLQDFAAALRDLEEYLRLSPKGQDTAGHEASTGGVDVPHPGDQAEAAEDETAPIWEHVKMLRKRVAGFN